MADGDYTVVQHDCRQYMFEMLQDGVRPNLIIADPPYNIGQDYADYQDRMREEEFLLFMHEWLDAAFDVLDDNGSMWVIVPDEFADDIGVYCKRSLGMHRRGWIVWFYTFGQNCRNKFNRSHVHLLYMTKKKPLKRKLKKDEKPPFTFNADAVKVPSARQLKYNDKRAKSGGKVPDDVWVLLKDDIEELLDPVGDSWSESRICGTFKERKSVSPNQIPVPILSRIVTACSNPGDLVLDPFTGTGSTGEACVIHGRRFIGIDVSEACVEATKERIDNAVGVAEAKAKAEKEQMELFPKN